MDVQQYLIIDDTESDAQYLKGLLSKLSPFELAGIVPTIEDALRLIDTQPIDLVFLDIKLNGQLGLSLLKTGVALPPVIITSAYADYALESYEIGKAADYLLKPYTAERLSIALDRAFQWPNQTKSVRTNTITLKINRSIQHVDSQLIDYVEAFGVYSKIYTGDRMFVASERFASVADRLPAHLFKRIHKSYLIHLARITGYDRNHIWLNQTKLPIGRSFRPGLSELLSVFDTNEE